MPEASSRPRVPEANAGARPAQLRPPGLRRAGSRAALVALTTLWTAAALPACFSPAAEGESSGVDSSTTSAADASNSASTSEAPTTSSSTTTAKATTTEATTAATTGPAAETSTGPKLDEPYCGDGFPDPEPDPENPENPENPDTGNNEECDDGDVDNSNACTNFCKWASCGDGFLGPGEECDDGNMLADDGCDGQCQCQRTACGNTVIDAGEECDGDLTGDVDICSSCCERRNYYVFVSSTFHVGDMLGGVQGADAKCTTLAATNNELPKSTYHAWLGPDRGVATPATAIFPHPYVLVGTGEIVAHSLQQLRSGQLETAIDRDEHGTDVGPLPADPCKDPNLRVWTGTDASGTGVWNTTCGSWSMPEQIGRFGAAGTAGPTWASCEAELDCGTMARLYCFEAQT